MESLARGIAAAIAGLAAGGISRGPHDPGTRLIHRLGPACGLSANGLDRGPDRRSPGGR